MVENVELLNPEDVRPQDLLTKIGSGSNKTRSNRNKLLKKARKVAENAHCPYSNNRVGSALIANGKIFVGANVEINGYGHTLCAERSAIAAAISFGAANNTDGTVNITEIAVACIDVPAEGTINKRAPCRTCRQWLAALAPQATVYIDGVQEEFYVSSEEWGKSCSRNPFQLEEKEPPSLWGQGQFTNLYPEFQKLARQERS